MKNTPLLILIITLLGCTNEQNIILINKENNTEILFPDEIDVRYRGFKVATGKLIDASGMYNLTEIEKGLQLSNNSVIIMNPNDLLKMNYELVIDSINIVENFKHVNDTFYYSVDNEYTKNEKLEEVLDTFKEVIDTLISKNPESIDELEESNSETK